MIAYATVRPVDRLFRAATGSLSAERILRGGADGRRGAADSGGTDVRAPVVRALDSGVLAGGVLDACTLEAGLDGPDVGCSAFSVAGFRDPGSGTAGDRACDAAFFATKGAVRLLAAFDEAAGDGDEAPATSPEGFARDPLANTRMGASTSVERAVQIRDCVQKTRLTSSTMIPPRLTASPMMTRAATAMRKRFMTEGKAGERTGCPPPMSSPTGRDIKVQRTIQRAQTV